MQNAMLKLYCNFIYKLEFNSIYFYKYSVGVKYKTNLLYTTITKYRSCKNIFFIILCTDRISVCFVFLSTIKASIQNYTCTIEPNIDLEKDKFLSWSYIYRIPVRLLFPSTVKVPSIDLEKDQFLSWLYIQDLCMFCISKYSYCNLNLHFHC